MDVITVSFRYEKSDKRNRMSINNPKSYFDKRIKKQYMYL
jgi:hypothetical protein